MSIFDFPLASTNWKMEYEFGFRVSAKNEKWKMDVHIPFSIFHSHWKMKITVYTRTHQPPLIAPILILGILQHQASA